MFPLTYALRNLARRPARTLATIACLGVTAFLIAWLLSFAGALSEAALSSGRDDVVVLLGTSSETDLVRSIVRRGHADDAAASAPGVAMVGDVRAASVELHLASRVGDRVGLLRGVTDSVYAVRPQVVLVEGREPRAPFELMAGRLAATRMGLPQSALHVGETIVLEGREWSICGRFAAPGTVSEAEMWVRLNDLMMASRREDVSCIALRLAEPGPAAVARVALFAAGRQDLEVAAITERELFLRVEEGVRPIAHLAGWMAVLVLIGALFACINTMFAAVLTRTPELGALLALGWSPTALGGALVLESIAISLVGGGAGVLVAWALGAIHLRFPMGALILEADASARGWTIAAILLAGAIGGLIPSRRALKLSIVDALHGRT